MSRRWSTRCTPAARSLDSAVEVLRVVSGVQASAVCNRALAGALNGRTNVRYTADVIRRPGECATQPFFDRVQAGIASAAGLLVLARTCGRTRSCASLVPSPTRRRHPRHLQLGGFEEWEGRILEDPYWLVSVNSGRNARSWHHLVAVAVDEFLDRHVRLVVAMDAQLHVGDPALLAEPRPATRTGCPCTPAAAEATECGLDPHHVRVRPPGSIATARAGRWSADHAGETVADARIVASSTCVDGRVGSTR